eukprot:TRINITY_DN9451_c0_g2_i1.p2 TRINITY_DN9451_c0_g2~~TRINITY_DN9451_c0_g2_i1.p2  ORF type:complete len:112 (-),score=9.52 TRINITY_DN9451_c0_g2_i1:103-438(-)
MSRALLSTNLLGSSGFRMWDGLLVVVDGSFSSYFCRFSSYIQEFMDNVVFLQDVGCYGREIGVKGSVLRGLAPRSILDSVYLFDCEELLLHFHESLRVFGELLKVVQVVLD